MNVGKIIIGSLSVFAIGLIGDVLYLILYAVIAVSFPAAALFDPLNQGGKVEALFSSVEPQILFHLILTLTASVGICLTAILIVEKSKRFYLWSAIFAFLINSVLPIILGAALLFTTGNRVFIFDCFLYSLSLLIAAPLKGVACAAIFKSKKRQILQIN